VTARRTKGEGSIFQRADGMWVGRIDLGWIGGRRVRKQVTAKTKRELTPKFRKLQRDVEGGVMSDAMTVEQWLRYWFEKVAPARCKQRTLDGYRTYLEQYLIPQLGKHRLDKLNPSHVRALYAWMNERGLSKTTQRQAHAILRRALVVAEREGKVARNAAALVDPPEIVENHHKPLTVAEARKVLRALDGDPLAARWICALLLGMRQGECLGLRWEDVDFDGGRLYVRNELVRIRSGGLVMTDPKSRSSKRPIPFGAVAPAAVALERTERRGEFVFYGKAQDPRADWGAWKALLVRAGVCDATVPLGEMPALHAARTTTGSLLDEAGVSDKIIAEILGHSQVQITRRAYIHGNEDRHRAGLGALAELVADRAEGTA
jgi:integrase